MIKWVLYTLIFCLSLVYLIILLKVESVEIRATFPKYGGNFYKPLIPQNIEEITLKVPTKEGILDLYGWYVAGSGSKTVYYFHGNGGALRDFSDDIAYIHQLGYSVMAYDYPGYGDSTGIPTDQNLQAFSEAFYEKIKSQKHFDESDLVVWGYSVGTAVGTQFLASHKDHTIILMAPFASKYAMGAHYFFGFPPQRLFFHPNELDTRSTLKDFHNRLLILHGTSDEIIPFSQGWNIYQESQTSQKYFITLPKARHNGILNQFGDSLKPIFQDFIDGNKLDFTTLVFDALAQEKYKSRSIPTSQALPKSSGVSPSFDLVSDSSLVKYVSPSVSFEDQDYVPSDLEKISGDSLVISKPMQLRKEALTHLQLLADAFYAQFQVQLRVVSAYRSYVYQQGIEKSGCPEIYCARAGHSEHQTGLAVDLFETTNKDAFLAKKDLLTYYQWLQEHAHLYGFHNSYQYGKAIDGYEAEPWHWRYLGVGLATTLSEKKMTFSQYIQAGKN